MKQKIIEECKKYGYELNWEENNYLSFINRNAHKDLQVFDIQVDEELERVCMAIIIDLGSWNEAIEYDLNNEEEIMNGIKNWISEDNLNSILEWLED